MDRRSNNNQKFDGPRCNERIRIPEIRVIHDGKNLGIMKTKDALAKAKDLELDLVEVSPTAKPPVCHIMDYGKFVYEKNKRAKDQKSSAVKEKEIKFRYIIDNHDLETKANQAKKFLEKGFKVKLVVWFKAREKAHKDQGFAAIKHMLTLLAEVAEVDKEPSFEGTNITAKLKQKKGSTKNEQGSSAVQGEDVAKSDKPAPTNS